MSLNRIIKNRTAIGKIPVTFTSHMITPASFFNYCTTISKRTNSSYFLFNHFDHLFIKLLSTAHTPLKYTFTFQTSQNFAFLIWTNRRFYISIRINLKWIITSLANNIIFSFRNPSSLNTLNSNSTEQSEQISMVIMYILIAIMINAFAKNLLIVKFFIFN